MKYLVVALSLFSVMGFGQVLNDRRALHHWVYEIRDPQTDAKTFRHSLEKIGEFLGYEVLDDLSTKVVSVETLTGAVASHVVCDETPVLVTILRAGVPLLDGVHAVFPDAEVGFLGMARDEETLQSKIDYIALPDMQDKTVILVDTMLATGGSFVDAIKIVEGRGPKKIIVVCAIASQAGISKIVNYNDAIEIYPAAIDPDLNEKGYIVPGLGDAGDRSYGNKR